MNEKENKIVIPLTETIHQEMVKVLETQERDHKTGKEYPGINFTLTGNDLLYEFNHVKLIAAMRYADEDKKQVEVNYITYEV